ncbi:LOW QUALITY PROTEIN: nuclear protein MDM1 [Lethenteron reissneri]|uniref:LOW QUALITY PROTEIN: nuclear protein MDM1 n=1 Tax=Lethenteron reissneri TaxID=7753 RepID=UPI002AB619DE|nr:LOW QUALITY PROTEIN: nuclear protein MDM1 [Lethenteron reissneri]
MYLAHLSRSLEAIASLSAASACGGVDGTPGRIKIPTARPGATDTPRYDGPAQVRRVRPGATDTPRYDGPAQVRRVRPGATDTSRYGRSTQVRQVGPGATDPPRCDRSTQVPQTRSGTEGPPRCHRPTQGTNMTKKVAWAGLRSDELGISREPGFISKRRVPYYVPRVGESLQWNAESHDLSGRDLSGRDLSGRDANNRDMKFTVASSARPVSKAERKSAVSVPIITSPKGQRVKRTEDKAAADITPAAESLSNTATRATHERPAEKSLTAMVPAAQTSLVILSPPSPKQAPSAPDFQAARAVEANVSEGVKHVLKRKAGMNVAPKRSFQRSSEYQHRYGGRTYTKVAPVLLAEQLKKTKADALISKRRPLLETRPRPKDEQPAEVAQQRDAVRIRKLKSEYMENFRAPCHYKFGDGGWVGIRSQHSALKGAEQSRSSGWLAEVRDLREKAELYKRRLLGTHFSRDHLNQILSEQNERWDQQSTSSVAAEDFSSAVEALDLARVRDKQRAWARRPCEKGGGVAGTAQERQVGNGRADNFKGGAADEADGAARVATEAFGKPPAESAATWEENASGDAASAAPTATFAETRELVAHGTRPHTAKEEADDAHERWSTASVGSEASADGGGRFPTPRLTALGGAQRTHHDLTTPAVGGALLVSPPKEGLGSQRRETPLGKPFSPHKYRDGASAAPTRSGDSPYAASPQSAARAPDLLPCAGTRTFDPLPLREEPWPSSPAREPLLHSAPARLLPDAEERIALLSARSEASSSAASELLERAVQRRRDAWTKKTPG